MEDKRIDIQETLIMLSTELRDIKNETQIENVIKKIFEDYLKEMKDEVDIEPIIQNALEQIKLDSSVKPIAENENSNEILKNTINLCYVHKFEPQLALESFKELAKYDNILHSTQGKYFHKIYQMLEIMVQYRELIEKLEQLEGETVHKRGIAKTKYEEIEEAIIPNLNHYEKALEFNDINENRLANNIAQSFNSSPREINAALETFDVNLIKNINKSQLETFKNQNTFYNSSEKLDEIHLYKSCQITCFSLFKKNPLTQTFKSPTNEKLANYINNIFNDFFDMYESKLNRNHINKPIQTKTYFQGIEIFEYQTPKNIKEHPLFK